MIQAPMEILGSLGITGNLAALIVGLYYGYKLWGDVHDRRKHGASNGHRDQLERERAVIRVIERVDNRAEMVKAEVGMTRHDLRNEMNAGFLNSQVETRDLSQSIAELGTLLAGKLEAVKEAILVLPQKIQGRN